MGGLAFMIRAKREHYELGFAMFLCMTFMIFAIWQAMERDLCSQNLSPAEHIEMKLSC